MTRSGASQLFSGSAATMKKKGVSIPPGHPTYTSAEETTFESVKEGGWGSLLVPVSVGNNKSRLIVLTLNHVLMFSKVEGSRYNSQLSAKKVAQLDYIKKAYTGLSTKT